MLPKTILIVCERQINRHLSQKLVLSITTFFQAIPLDELNENLNSTICIFIYLN
jgi:hypothetical protein